MKKKNMDSLYNSLSKDQFRFLRMMSHMPYYDMPAQILIDKKLVAKELVRSGRNPEYGWKITSLGSALVSYITSMAINKYLDDNP